MLHYNCCRYIDECTLWMIPFSSKSPLIQYWTKSLQCLYKHLRDHTSKTTYVYFLCILYFSEETRIMLTNSDGIIPYNSCSSYLDFDDEELKRYPQLDLGKLWIHLHTIDNIIVLINKFSISFNHECTVLWIIIISHGQFNVNFQGGYNVFY